jgi:tetratricopeptide (TPR) repeat protein
MVTEPSFDLADAHEYFSVQCFNQVWNLIDKPDRTPADDQEMVELCLASLWHWSQRDDCTPTNLSIGYWQASRVYVLLGQAENAMRYARMCLNVSHASDVLPFYLGYAYEAMARAASAAKDHEKVAEYLAKANRVATAISDPEERDQLLEDLETIN